MRRQGLASTVTLAVLLLWGAFCTVPVRAEDRRSVAEELVRELKELELAVERREPATEVPTTSPTPVTTTTTSTTTSTSGNDVVDPSTLMEETVDKVEGALEDAVNNVEEEMEDMGEEAQEDMESAEEAVDKDLETTLQGAEEELEEAGDSQDGGRGKGKGKGQGKGKGKGKGKMLRKAEERRRRNQARRQHKMLDAVTRFLQRVIRRLQNDGASEATLTALQAILSEVQNLMNNPAETTTTTMATETTTSGSGEEENSATEGGMTTMSTPATSTLPVPVARQLSRLLRLLSNTRP